MTREMPDGPLGSGPTVGAFDINRCSEPGCKGTRDRFIIKRTANTSDGLTAGVYRLYVVADQAPVRFVFQIPALEGKTIIRPADDTAVEIRTLTPRIQESGTRTVYSAGDYTRLERLNEGFGFLGLWVRGDNHLGTGFGSCYYYGGIADPPQEAAFLPGCPTGHSTPHMSQLTGPGQKGGIIFTSFNWEFPSGIGGWYASISEVRAAGAVALWLQY